MQIWAKLVLVQPFVPLLYLEMVLRLCSEWTGLTLRGIKPSLSPARSDLERPKKVSPYLTLPMGYGLTCLTTMKILFLLHSLGIQNVFTQNISQAVSSRLAGGAEKVQRRVPALSCSLLLGESKRSPTISNNLSKCVYRHTVDGFCNSIIDNCLWNLWHLQTEKETNLSCSCHLSSTAKHRHWHFRERCSFVSSSTQR